MKPTIDQVPLALLAGGLATRLRDVTRGACPKALVEVAGKPFIDHQLALFHQNGVRHVVLCLGHLGVQVEAHVGDGSRFGLVVEYSHDGPELLGTGGALRRAMPMLGELFWVVYGDSYTDIDFAGILASFIASPAQALMTVLENENRWDKSNVRFEAGKLLCYDKLRPLPAMRHVDYGVALLRREALLRVPPAHPADLADLYHALVSEGKMAGHLVHNRFYEIGTPASWEEASRYLSQRAAG